MRAKTYLTTKTALLALLLGECLMTSVGVRAEINNNRPPFSLTLEQARHWSPASVLADKNNVSSVALQERFVAHLDENQPKLDDKVKVLIAPDGMNNLANYLGQEHKFNLYNFSHWSHIDVLNWFAGTANETVNIPSRPWVEVAHKNGVKVIGTIYLAVAQYGGNVETVAALLEQDQQGRFPMAHQLVAIADYYGFDGWLINPETDLTQVKNDQGQVIADRFEYKNAALLGKQMQAFMAYLTELAPQEMEIHWYDAMLADGSVKWQNQLNEKNAPFLQSGGVTQANSRISDAMFINYWWNGDMVAASNKFVKKLNRSPYELYFGADLSPQRNAQKIFTTSEWLHALFPGDGTKALSSIALFANEVNFTFPGDKHTPPFSTFSSDPRDVRRFYDSETRFFAGDDLNLQTYDRGNSWPGIGRYVPAKSTLTALPFSTSFSTGHGLFYAVEGKKQPGAWHDISRQDVLPTWQFAVSGNQDISLYYDFERAYRGGNSLALRAEHLAENKEKTDIALYQTRFLLNENSRLELSFMHQTSAGQAVAPQIKIWLQTATVKGKKQRIEFALVEQENSEAVGHPWSTLTFSLAQYAGKTIERIGFSVEAGAAESLATNIGFFGLE